MSQKNHNSSYYVQATQSIFIIAGILILFTFPYFIRSIDFSIFGILALIVLLSILAGLSSAKKKTTKILSVLVTVAAFALSSLKAMDIFFQGVTEPLEIFSFWVLQLLALIFFFGIYISIRSLKK